MHRTPRKRRGFKSGVTGAGSVILVVRRNRDSCGEHMQVTVGKILSVVVVVAYALVAVSYAGAAGLKWCTGLLLPLAFIWFPEEIGSITGYFRTGYVNVQTPGVFISLLGWFFLVVLPVLLYLIHK